MGNIYEVSDTFWRRYDSQWPEFRESFADYFFIDSWKAADIIAADTELKLKLALELREEAYLRCRHNHNRALKQHECRIAHGSPHPCRELVYGSIHGCCLQAFRYALRDNSIGESAPHSGPPVPVPWRHTPTSPRHDLEVPFLNTSDLVSRRRSLQTETHSSLLPEDFSFDRRPR